MDIYNISNEELLNLVKTRLVEDKSFHKSLEYELKNYKSSAKKKEQRSAKENALSKLFKTDFSDVEPTEFIKRVKEICDGDTSLFHRYHDLYIKERRKADRQAGRPYSI